MPAILALASCGGSTDGAADSHSGATGGSGGDAASGGPGGSASGTGGQDVSTSGGAPSGIGGQDVSASGGAPSGIGGQDVSASGGAPSGIGGQDVSTLGGAPGTGGSGTGGWVFAGAGGDAGSAGGDAGSAGGDAGSAGGDAGSAGQFPACEDAASALEQLIPDDQACTFIMRLTFTTREPLGYQIVCGDPRLDVTEEEARATATEATGWTSWSLASDPELDELYVFEERSGDYGAVGVVSAYTGLMLFGGRMYWYEHGGIGHPTEWRSTDELQRCDPPDELPLARPVGSYSGLDLSEPVLRVWSTALPRAMSLQAVSLHSIAVLVFTPMLTYPLGGFDASTAEIIVFVNWDFV